MGGGGRGKGGVDLLHLHNAAPSGRTWKIGYTLKFNEAKPWNCR